jgi:hypothetical protein
VADSPSAEHICEAVRRAPAAGRRAAVPVRRLVGITARHSPRSRGTGCGLGNKGTRHAVQSRHFWLESGESPNVPLSTPVRDDIVTDSNGLVDQRGQPWTGGNTAAHHGRATRP